MYKSIILIRRLFILSRAAELKVRFNEGHRMRAKKDFIEEKSIIELFIFNI